MHRLAMFAARYDFLARADDELSVDRGEIVRKAYPLTDEEGWVRVSGRHGEGLVPRDYLRERPQTDADRDKSMGRSTTQPQSESTDEHRTPSSAEALGQKRARPDWGYDHGVAFDGLDSSHPLWMEAAIEEAHSHWRPDPGSNSTPSLFLQ